MSRWFTVFAITSVATSLCACARSMKTQAQVQDQWGDVLKFREKVLSTKVTCNYQDASLRHVVRDLAREVGVSIVLDEGGWGPNKVPEVTIEANNMAFRDALHHLLKQAGLSYTWYGRSINISTPDKISLWERG